MSHQVEGAAAGSTYHKIITAWKRDPDTKHKTLIPNAWATEAFEYLRSLQWVWTEKIDGTNIRIHFTAGRWPEDGSVLIGGRSNKAQIPHDLFDRLTQMFTVPVVASQFHLLKRFETVTLYGEGFGPGIQKGGGNYRGDKGFILFDVKVGDRFMQQSSVREVGEQMGIEVVPVIGQGTLARMISRVKTGMQSTFGDFQAEGIVARPVTELVDRFGQRIITKIKVKDFPS